jgi:hypothetical protein
MRHCWPTGSNGEGCRSRPINSAFGAFRHGDLPPVADPFTEIVAKAIFQIAQTGVRDAVQLRKLALEQIGTPPAG